MRHQRREEDSLLGRATEEARRWAMVVLIALVVVLGWYVSQLSLSVHHIDGAIARIEKSSTKTEAAASELVDFVHEIQAQQTASTGNGGQSQVVQMLVNLLCASSDSARQKACSDLTNPGG